MRSSVIAACFVCPPSACIMSDYGSLFCSDPGTPRFRSPLGFRCTFHERPHLLDGKLQYEVDRHQGINQHQTNGRRFPECTFCYSELCKHHNISSSEEHSRNPGTEHWRHLDPKETLAAQGIETQPGPDSDARLRIESRNIRGLSSNLASAIRKRAQIITLQEADVNEASINDVQAQANVAGYKIIWGNPCATGQDANSS